MFHPKKMVNSSPFFLVKSHLSPPAGSQHFGGSHCAVAAGGPLELGAFAGGGHAADSHGAAGAAETWRYFQWGVTMVAHEYYTGWWFGTCFFSIIYGIILPIDYIIFFKMVKTTNQQVFLHGFCLEIESNSGTPQKNDQPICQLGTVQHWAVPFWGWSLLSHPLASLYL